MESSVSLWIGRVAQHDDQRAFRELFNHYFAGLLGYAHSIVHTSPVAEEIVEDVFVKLWENRKMLEAIKSPSLYLYTAVKNTALNYLHKNVRHAYVYMEDIGESPIVAFSRATPENDCIEKDNLRVIADAIQVLPPKCRLIFCLAKEEELSHKEIAQLLDISPKTVENQLAIALKKIAETIQVALPEFSSLCRRCAK